MNYFGQTQTRTTAPPEQIAAMNAPKEQLPGMCAAGNRYACDLAKLPQPSEVERREMAIRRDQQAAADRAALAQRLENVGQRAVAQAVRQQRDAVYVTKRNILLMAGAAAGVLGCVFFFMK